MTSDLRSALIREYLVTFKVTDSFTVIGLMMLLTVRFLSSLIEVLELAMRNNISRGLESAILACQRLSRGNWDDEAEGHSRGPIRCPDQYLLMTQMAGLSSGIAEDR